MTSRRLILLLPGIQLHHMLILPIPPMIPQLAQPLQPLPKAPLLKPHAPLLKLLVASLPLLLLHLHLLLTGSIVANAPFDVCGHPTRLSCPC
jgi:hypothetical protein